MHPLLTRLANSSALRFLLSGGFNTACTYAVYLLLLVIFPYQLSYTIAFASGIALAYVLNRGFVFRSHRGLHSVLLLPLTYLGQYAIGLCVLWLWINILDWPEESAPLAAILVTLPLNYLFSRFAFMKRPQKTKQ
ncbi:GtrA family protein [Pseudomonas donghuensis]|uniref:GtrA family protein n=1 Tax=Pseudomonas donghuensis TaxID=1163398 RepID=UPI00068326B7|nr:GtrA family protein [Pseudomonas donghuensis]